MKFFLGLCIATAIATGNLFAGDVPASEKTVIWLTGLPCSGKSTIANQLKEYIPDSSILDGDQVRKTLNSDLGFSPEDRQENLRRTTEVAKLLLNSNKYVMIACVSPAQAVRDNARAEIEALGYNFLEVHVNAPVDTCIERDVKGMYKKALAGEIPVFTGVSAPYEDPATADVVCNTSEETVVESAKKILAALDVQDPQVGHAMFVGRWTPFHKGHWAIMEKVHKENPEQPLLVMVRNTKNEYWTAEYRKAMVEAGLKAMGIKGTVIIIPDIKSINWGRGVGYTPRMVDVDASIHAISGTEIRRGIKAGEDAWKECVCPGVADYILANPR